jgi:tetratricopeptide (TPR) repeat protein
VLLLLDAWPLARLGASPKRCVLEKLPLFCLAAGTAVVTLLVQGEACAMRFGEAVPFDLRLANAVDSIATYLRQTVWPLDLAAFYPYPESLPRSRVLVTAAALGAVTAGALALRRSRPELAVGWLWFGVMLLPVLGLVQVGMQARADRYLYLPQTGLALAVAVTAGRWAADSARRRLAIGVVATVAIAFLAVQARVQVGTWQNDETLFRRALEVTEGNYVAHHQLAADLARHGRHAEAADHYGAAIALRPEWVLPQLGLAESLAARGETRLAIERLRALLRLDPTQAAAALRLGLLLAQEGRDTEARALLESWIARAERRGAGIPGLAVAHFALGDLDLAAGRPETAVTRYRRGLAVSPAQIQGRKRLARALANLGHWDEAAVELRTALDLGGDTPEIHASLGRAYRRSGREWLAVAHLEESLRRAPGSDASLDLAWLLATATSATVRDPAGALALAEAHAASHPTDAASLDALAAAQASAGDFDLAVATAERALAAAQGPMGPDSRDEPGDPDGIRKRLVRYRAESGREAPQSLP